MGVSILCIWPAMLSLTSFSFADPTRPPAWRRSLGFGHGPGAGWDRVGGD